MKVSRLGKGPFCTDAPPSSDAVLAGASKISAY